eukprot:TRINITY_DN11253_c0_g1_i1.p1 TRINITY_DN11253_c0_g1~~TRINITY_DN11253_c0_g1_i1.p1  ORF type:complete len:399 (+),score=107.25 TRINITY_DN11253_c0_g1_i1:84-1280(+)
MATLSPAAKTALIAGFLTTGSINTLTKKWQFQTCSSSDSPPVGKQGKGCPEGQKKFDKPWSQNILMFVGESFMMGGYLVRQRKDGRTVTNGETARRPPFYIFSAPAACDVLGTGIGGVGMLYISASVWQMMRGSLLIFTSLLSVMMLKKKLYLYNWTAVLVCAVGLALIGVSAILDQKDDGNGSNGVQYALLGMGLTVLSQFFAATQMVLEEFFVKGWKASAEQTVGSEGVWGICVMVVMLTIMYAIPGQDAGSYENFIDSLQMIENSGTILAFVLMYLVSISIFNFLGVTIAGKLSAVHRTINDALRTSIVWIVQLIVYYAGAENYGTPWMAHSWLQLLGFGFLVLGNLLNNAIVRVPGLYYPPPNEPATCESTQPLRNSGSAHGASLQQPADSNGK